MAAIISLHINQTLLARVKTVAEFVSPLVVSTYKHDSLSTWQRLQWQMYEPTLLSKG